MAPGAGAHDNGRERGITAENVRDCERYLNQKYAKQLGKRPLTVFLLATTRDKLFPQLNAGLGDIAAGDLTETEAWLKLVDFVAPKDATPVCGNSSSATLVQSRNSVGRAVTSGNRTLAIRGAPCMGDTAYHQA